MEISTPFSAKNILSETSHNVQKIRSRVGSASTAVTLKARDTRPATANQFVPTSARNIVDPPAHKAYVLFKLQNKLEKKYPSLGVQKYMNRRVQNDEDLQNQSMPLPKEQEEVILEQLREAKRLKYAMKARVKYSHIPPKIDTHLTLSNPKETISATPVKPNRPKVERAVTSLKSNYNSEKAGRSLYVKKDLTSLSSVDKDHNTSQAPTANSLNDTFRPRSALDVSRETTPFSQVLSTLESKNHIPNETRPCSKDTIDTAQSSRRPSKASNENQNYSLNLRVRPRTSKLNEDPTKYKSLYQKFKDPRTKRTEISAVLPHDDDNLSNTSLHDIQKACLLTIQEGGETPMNNKKMQNDQSDFSSLGWPEPQEKRGMSAGAGNIRRRKNIKIKSNVDSLSSIQRTLQEIRSVLHSPKILSTQDGSQKKMRSFSRQMSRDYNRLDKNIKEQKMSKYDFHGYVKSLLEKSSLKNRSENEKSKTANTHNIFLTNFDKVYQQH